MPHVFTVKCIVSNNKSHIAMKYVTIQKNCVFLLEMLSHRHNVTRKNTIFRIVMVFLSMYEIWCENQISFTLYPPYSRVGRGNLVVRHYTTHTTNIFEVLHFEWQNSMLRFFTLLPK